MFSSAFLFPYAFGNKDYHFPTMSELFIAFALTGLPLTIGQLMIISSLTITKNYGMLTPFMFTNIIVGYLVSIFRYEEKVNGICLFGAVAIVIGVVFIVRNKDKAQE